MATVIHRLRPRDLKPTGPPEANSSILFCGICGLELHRVLYGDIRWPHVIGAEAEQACEHHYQTAHALRYRLWKKTGWKWFVRGLV